MTQAVKPETPDVLTITALQQHTREMCHYFEWDAIDSDKKFLLFVEEVGEMASAIRRLSRLAEDKSKENISEQQRRDSLASEMADVLSYLADLANRYDIDLEKAYRVKSEHNFSREWSK